MQKLVLLLVILAVVSCNSPNKEPTNHEDYEVELVEGRYNVAFLIMDGTFNTEFTAPYDIFQHTIFRKNIKAMNVFTIANSIEPITTFEGLRILPDFSYLDQNLPKIDILVVPSAEHHIDTDMNNEELINFVAKAAKTATYVTSHCDGAFILAKAGLLNDRESTTFPGDIELYRKTFPELTIHKDVFFVHDGKYITSSGGAKSFDAALYLTEHLYGKKVAEDIATGLVIDWSLEEVPHIIVAD